MPGPGAERQQLFLHGDGEGHAGLGAFEQVGGGDVAVKGESAVEGGDHELLELGVLTPAVVDGRWMARVSMSTYITLTGASSSPRK